MKRAVMSGVLLCLLAVITSQASSDVGGTIDSVTPAPTPNLPGDETEFSPFQPYSIGPPEAAVPYSALSPAEQAAADRGRDTTGWAGIHNAYAKGAVALAQQAAAEAAAAELGVENLAGQGVVP